MKLVVAANLPSRDSLARLGIPASGNFCVGLKSSPNKWAAYVVTTPRWEDRHRMFSGAA